MTPATPRLLERGAPVETWFGIGGGADLLARPAEEGEVVELLREHADARLRILGDGANLLIHDDGVDGLALSLEHLDEVRYPEEDEAAIVVAGAGANLPRVIRECVARGLAGVEGLAGIPATLGGAVMMNAGGAFGQIGDVVRRVHAVRRDGSRVTLARHEIGFDYRRSGLDGLVVTGVELALERVDRADRPALRESLKRVMAYKKGSQPMGERSAGCVFKNPTPPGKIERVSAGRMIDEAGCKGMEVGGASVSHVHANFVVTRPDASAAEVIELMARVRERVRAHAGIELEPEVVIWARRGLAAPSHWAGLIRGIEP